MHQAEDKMVARKMGTFLTRRNNSAVEHRKKKKGITMDSGSPPTEIMAFAGARKIKIPNYQLSLSLILERFVHDSEKK